MKILVIDDEKEIVLMMRDFLAMFEFDVTTSERGIEALEKLRENTYDVALLDMKLPDMTGKEVLKEIRSFNTDIKVIIVTGSATDYDDSIKQMGADAIIRKPIVLKSLVDDIKKIAG